MYLLLFHPFLLFLYFLYIPGCVFHLFSLELAITSASLSARDCLESKCLRECSLCIVYAENVLTQLYTMRARVIEWRFYFYFYFVYIKVYNY